MIGIIDYGAGNLRSVRNAFDHLGIDFFVSDDPDDFSRADRIVFPGVGEARAAMENLQTSGFDRLLKERFAAGIPILGICLGCQIVLERSEESDTTCLGLVPGRAVRFPDGARAEDGSILKVPHMGWNRVHHGNRHPLFRGVPEDSYFYFVHSYYPELADRRNEIGECRYGVSFSAAFAWKNLVAVQFHPEKSGAPGLALLANFARGTEEGPC